MLWWWFGGIAIILLLAAMRAGQLWINTAILLTVFPVLTGWLGFNGGGILLSVLPQLRPHDQRRDAMARVETGVLVLTGMVFTAGAAACVLAIVWRMAR